jgi:hypothetical protein
LNSKRVILAALLLAPAPGAFSGERAGPAVVELFTSQGCSYCPAAEDFLSEWGKDAARRGEIIPLAYHVDYWDYLGWKDPFGSRAFTERQYAYARAWKDRRVDTPQLVVDGRVGFVASDQAKARAEAGTPRRAARPAKLAAALKGGKLQVKASAGEAAVPGNARVMLAVFENSLVTEIPGGENAGRTVRSDFVVRRLFDLGRAPEGRSWKENSSLDWDPAWKPENAGAALFLQDEGSLHIVGAASVFPIGRD